MDVKSTNLDPHTLLLPKPNTGRTKHDMHTLDHLEPALHDSRIWRFTHALGFALGGTTFIAGTACYYFPSVDPTGLKSAILYTVGSFGFLFVDVLEFVTYTEDSYLRINISLSAVSHRSPT